MSLSFHHSKGRTSEPNSQKKPPPVEQPSLQELLREKALPHVATLSDEEEEVLHFLVLYGRNALLPPGASISPGRSCKFSSSKVRVRQQGCRHCSSSDVLEASACFSCYSRVWRRWNASPNRDVISDILDSIENPSKEIENPQENPPERTSESNTPQVAPQVSKGKKKKKKRLDKKREISETNLEKGESLQFSRIEALYLIDGDPHPLGSMDTICDDGGPEVSITMENGPIISSVKVIAGHMKGLLRGLKQKEKPFATSPNSAFTDLIIENTGSSSISMTVGSGSPSETVAIEIPENLTLGLSPRGSLGPSSSVSQGKITTKLQQPHWRGKRRRSQILPFDCEDIPVDNKEQEAVTVLENTQMSSAPRAADVGLGGRGFLARVFPDALGRVASRLWDLVSVRLRSRAVEYH
ncbi:hypothetical protein GOP47_0024175 [Adiantum capillus-veneris]|uniref:Uncharacterized protein n=1 Tax=Adiantum capillus-veneris TaxID=13818 RepID=A0A9D4U5E5_ADICA|nr:hypothetical protein GOP47_0024175 [Adiantum capillus-veneris]